MIVIIVMMSFTVLFLTKNFYDAFASIQSRLESSKHLFDRFIKKSVVVKGRVLSVSYYSEYSYPGLSAEEVFNKKLEQEDILKFEEKRASVVSDLNEYGHVSFRYGYFFSGNKITSRTISSYGNSFDLDFLYKYKKGDLVDVFVDPDDPFISALVKPSEKEHHEMVWNILIGFIPKVFFIVSAWLVLAGVLYSSFS